MVLFETNPTMISFNPGWWNKNQNNSSNNNNTNNNKKNNNKKTITITRTRTTTPTTTRRTRTIRTRTRTRTGAATTTTTTATSSSTSSGRWIDLSIHSHHPIQAELQVQAPKKKEDTNLRSDLASDGNPQGVGNQKSRCAFLEFSWPKQSPTWKPQVENESRNASLTFFCLFLDMPYVTSGTWMTSIE